MLTDLHGRAGRSTQRGSLFCDTNIIGQKTPGPHTVAYTRPSAAQAVQQQKQHMLQQRQHMLQLKQHMLQRQQHMLQQKQHMLQRQQHMLQRHQHMRT